MAIVWRDEFDYPDGPLPLTDGTTERRWMPKARWQMDDDPDTGYHDFAGNSYNRNPNGTDSTPFTVEGGVLRIEAIGQPRTFDGQTSPWQGGMLISNPRYGEAGAWTYGYFEWRARYPNPGLGMFPALWMFGSESHLQPSGKECAEIDAVEVFGHDSGRPWESTLHLRGGAVCETGDMASGGSHDEDTTGWHRYGIEWTPTAVRIYRDGALRQEWTGADAAWFQDTILDVRCNVSMAADGSPSWFPSGNFADGSTPDPMVAEVDYVRVYDSAPDPMPQGADDPEASAEFDPTGMSRTPVPGVGMQLDWDESPSDVVDYHVFRRPASEGTGPFDPKVDEPLAVVEGTSYLDDGVPFEVEHAWQTFGRFEVPDEPDDPDHLPANPVDPATASHTIPLSMDTADGNGNLSGVQPGDVIALESGTRGRLRVENLHGTKANPVVIVNDGGVVNINVSSGSVYACLEIRNCTHLRITGSGAPGGVGRYVGSAAYEPGMTMAALESMQDAGIVVTSTHSSPRGVTAKRFDDPAGLFGPPGLYEVGIEVDHLEVTGARTGFNMTGEDDAAGYTWVGFTMRHNFVHDMSTHEGWYIGRGNYSTAESDTAGVRIFRNFAIRTARDTCQIGNSWVYEGEWRSRVHDNVFAQAGVGAADPQDSFHFIARNGCTADVFNNYLFDAGRDAVRCQGNGGSRFWNNVIARTGNGVTTPGQGRGFRIANASFNWQPDKQDGNPGGALIVNNTIVDCDEQAIHFTNDMGSSVNIARNNVMRGNDGGITTSSGASATTSHNLTSNPQFVAPGSDDYRLQSGSPAIDAGTDQHADLFSYDIEGIARPQGSGWDIGAHERTST